MLTHTEMLDIVKTMIDDSTESETTLSVFLSIAKQTVMNRLYPFGTEEEEVPSKYQIVQCKIAAYYLNKRGAEGETLHIENGVHRTYSAADLPHELISEIVPMVGVV